MKILAVSDVELDTMYSPDLKERYHDVDLVVGCGDLPFFYLEYIISSLGAPLYYVRGNHAPQILHSYKGDRVQPAYGVNLHARVRRDTSGLLFAGVEGCLRYNRGYYQYTQSEMWDHVLGLMPQLMMNRLMYGRFLDVFVTHAPPWKIHDQPDLPHQGIKAFLWLNKVFQPRYHLHGHIHVYSQYTQILTEILKTKVLNVYGYQIIEI
jgi:Icc-related predicted phosphoesterase